MQSSKVSFVSLVVGLLYLVYLSDFTFAYVKGHRRHNVGQLLPQHHLDNHNLGKGERPNNRICCLIDKVGKRCGSEYCDLSESEHGVEKSKKYHFKLSQKDVEDAVCNFMKKGAYPEKYFHISSILNNVFLWSKPDKYLAHLCKIKVDQLKRPPLYNKGSNQDNEESKGLEVFKTSLLSSSKKDNREKKLVCFYYNTGSYPGSYSLIGEYLDQSNLWSIPDSELASICSLRRHRPRLDYVNKKSVEFDSMDENVELFAICYFAKFGKYLTKANKPSQVIVDSKLWLKSDAWFRTNCKTPRPRRPVEFWFGAENELDDASAPQIPDELLQNSGLVNGLWQVDPSDWDNLQKYVYSREYLKDANALERAKSILVHPKIKTPKKTSNKLHNDVEHNTSTVPINKIRLTSSLLNKTHTVPIKSNDKILEQFSVEALMQQLEKKNIGNYIRDTLNKLFKQGALNHTLKTLIKKNLNKNLVTLKFQLATARVKSQIQSSIITELSNLLQWAVSDQLKKLAKLAKETKSLNNLNLEITNKQNIILVQIVKLCKELTTQKQKQLQSVVEYLFQFVKQPDFLQRLKLVNPNKAIKYLLLLNKLSSSAHGQLKKTIENLSKGLNIKKLIEQLKSNSIQIPTNPNSPFSCNQQKYLQQILSALSKLINSQDLFDIISRVYNETDFDKLFGTKFDPKQQSSVMIFSYLKPIRNVLGNILKEWPSSKVLKPLADLISNLFKKLHSYVGELQKTKKVDINSLDKFLAELKKFEIKFKDEVKTIKNKFEKEPILSKILDLLQTQIKNQISSDKISSRTSPILQILNKFHKLLHNILNSKPIRNLSEQFLTAVSKLYKKFNSFVVELQQIKKIDANKLNQIELFFKQFAANIVEELQKIQNTLAQIQAGNLTIPLNQESHNLIILLKQLLGDVFNSNSTKDPEKGIITTLQKILQQTLYGGSIENLKEGVSNMVSSILDGLSNFISRLLHIRGISDKEFGNISPKIENLKKKIAQKVNKIIITAFGQISKIANTIEKLLGNLINGNNNTLSSIFKGVDINWSNILNPSNSSDSILSLLPDDLRSILLSSNKSSSNIENIFKSFFDDKHLTGLLNIIPKILLKLTNSIFGDLAGLIQPILQSAGINNNEFNKILPLIKSFQDSIGKDFENIIPKIFQLQDIDSSNITDEKELDNFKNIKSPYTFDRFNSIFKNFINSVQPLLQSQFSYLLPVLKSFKNQIEKEFQKIISKSNPQPENTNSNSDTVDVDSKVEVNSLVSPTLKYIISLLLSESDTIKNEDILGTELPTKIKKIVVNLIDNVFRNLANLLQPLLKSEKLNNENLVNIFKPLKNIFNEIGQQFQNIIEQPLDIPKILQKLLGNIFDQSGDNQQTSNSNSNSDNQNIDWKENINLSNITDIISSLLYDNYTAGSNPKALENLLSNGQLSALPSKIYKILKNLTQNILKNLLHLIQPLIKSGKFNNNKLDKILGPIEDIINRIGEQLQNIISQPLDISNILHKLLGNNFDGHQSTSLEDIISSLLPKIGHTNEIENIFADREITALPNRISNILQNLIKNIFRNLSNLIQPLNNGKFNNILQTGSLQNIFEHPLDISSILQKLLRDTFAGSEDDQESPKNSSSEGPTTSDLNSSNIDQSPSKSEDSSSLLSLLSILTNNENADKIKEILGNLFGDKQLTELQRSLPKNLLNLTNNIFRDLKNVLKLLSYSQKINNNELNNILPQIKNYQNNIGENFQKLASIIFQYGSNIAKLLPQFIGNSIKAGDHHIKSSENQLTDNSDSIQHISTIIDQLIPKNSQPNLGSNSPLARLPKQLVPIILSGLKNHENIQDTIKNILHNKKLGTFLNIVPKTILNISNKILGGLTEFVRNFLDSKRIKNDESEKILLRTKAFEDKTKQEFQRIITNIFQKPLNTISQA